MGTICTRVRSYSAIVHVYILHGLVPKHEYYSYTICGTAVLQLYYLWYSCICEVHQARNTCTRSCDAGQIGVNQGL